MQATILHRGSSRVCVFCPQRSGAKQSVLALSRLQSGACEGPQPRDGPAGMCFLGTLSVAASWERWPNEDGRVLYPPSPGPIYMCWLFLWEVAQQWSWLCACPLWPSAACDRSLSREIVPWLTLYKPWRFWIRFHVQVSCAAMQQWTVKCGVAVTMHAASHDCKTNAKLTILKYQGFSTSISFGLAWYWIRLVF